tara:strand:- start:262 stop:1158 length:897 start_codon:yes stop_codon:yes gene_type:complete
MKDNKETEKSKVQNYCRECKRTTNHDVEAEKKIHGNGEYNCEIIYQIVSCRGCDTYSFRDVFVDIESAYPMYNNEWVVPEDVTTYPKSLQGHNSFEGILEIPLLVRKIYQEVLYALREDAKVLAGLGLRAVLEAVCNELKITGKDLRVRINHLQSKGFISKNDAERLHGIRFMGNDSAHEIKTPKDDALEVALQIIEHLLLSVYILEKKSDGTLETATSKYDKFIQLLDKALNDFEKGDEYPIQKFLGKQMRVVQEAISNLENELVSNIKSGKYKKLEIGKKEKFNNSKQDLQHFIKL